MMNNSIIVLAANLAALAVAGTKNYFEAIEENVTSERGDTIAYI